MQDSPPAVEVAAGLIDTGGVIGQDHQSVVFARLGGPVEEQAIDAQTAEAHEEVAREALRADSGLSGRGAAR